jgi:hypothetical protein
LNKNVDIKFSNTFLEQPSSGTLKQPSSGTLKQPSSGMLKQPSSGTPVLSNNLHQVCSNNLQVPDEGCSRNVLLNLISTFLFKSDMH